MNETMLRALSTYSRIATINTNSPSLPKDFLLTEHNFRMLDFDNITFSDFMQIVSGQIPPELMLQLINDDLQLTAEKDDDHDDHDDHDGNKD
jgi:hypothetical protein